MKHQRDIVRAGRPTLRQPRAEDGAAIWELIRACKPLDENSMYCNLLQCDHFAETCVVAERQGRIVGWISGYVKPNDPQTLFVWQVAVSEEARGLGLGILMLQDIMKRPACTDVRRLQTTITGDNAASWALFRKFGRMHNSPLDVEPLYTKSVHFQDRQKTENVVTIRVGQRLKAAA